MTTPYQHILVAVDFMPDQHQITQRAVRLAQQFNARLSFAHIVEYYPVDFANELILPQDLELEAQLLSNARKRLEEITRSLDISDVAAHVEIGQASREILRIAEQQHADLIIVGSHGRHGFRRILGSTANAIMHHADCDVLAVRITSTNSAES